MITIVHPLQANGENQLEALIEKQKKGSFTLIICGLFHGPLSERMQPPLSAHVQ